MNCRRLASVASLLYLSMPCSAVQSNPVSAIASEAPVTCASPVAATPTDLDAAYARELDSPAILHFLTSLAKASPQERKRTFDAALTSASTEPELHAQAAVSAACPDALYGIARASYLVVNLWQLGGFSNAAKFRTFLTVLATAVAASSESESVSAEDRASALLPFEDLLAHAPEEPSAAMPGACTRPDVPARVLHTVEPSYSPAAMRAGTTGTVLVLVQLSDAGDVRSARLVRDSLGRGGGWQDLVHASILAAGGSTYAPQVNGCTPILGSYIFQADFRSS